MPDSIREQIQAREAQFLSPLATQAAFSLGRVVDEANLTQNIAMVRRALAAERGTSAFIETFPGRGYRLIGPVAVEETATGNLTPEPLPESLAEEGSVSVTSLSLPSAGENAEPAQTQSRSRTGLRLQR